MAIVLGRKKPLAAMGALAIFAAQISAADTAAATAPLSCILSGL
jgi:hypothetical protein